MSTDQTFDMSSLRATLAALEAAHPGQDAAALFYVMGRTGLSADEVMALGGVPTRPEPVQFITTDEAFAESGLIAMVSMGDAVQLWDTHTLSCAVVCRVCMHTLGDGLSGIDADILLQRVGVDVKCACHQS